MVWNILGAILALFAMTIVVQLIKKYVYGKRVLKALEMHAAGKFFMNVRNSPDEEFRMRVALLESQVLIRAYRRKATPEEAASAIVFAAEAVGMLK